MTWYQQAACQGQDTELFFPIGSTGPAVIQLEAAKRICAACPVKDPCLEWAVRTGMDHGVWGGMSEVERRAVRFRVARS